MTRARLAYPLLPLLGLALLLATAWLAYRPGLSGGFLFDDLANLPALGATGAVDDWPTFWRYLTSGIADPTGRPLALLSFLLDARDWPADPAPFLRTNLVLHLVNGALLFLLLRQLGRRIDGRSRRNDATALLGAGLWLLHPLFVSTTLYIVQREAMLPATFTLLGLISWVHGRERYDNGRQLAGLLWMSAGVGLGTLLAVLSKANGVLLPLLIWMLEATALQQHARAQRSSAVADRRLRWLRLGLLVLPSLLVFFHLLRLLPLVNDTLAGRPWTIGERLLTEPRVLLDYLQLLVVPRALSTGLYNDGYIASTGLFHPATTLPALMLVLGLLALGFGLRRRAPVWAAALLFFFAGHLLESSIVPLELYFEHRNYLPALLLFWPVARALCHWPTATATRAAVALALLALCAFTTHQRAALWGQPGQMARLWAQQNPQSPRAQAAVAMDEVNAGHPERALQRIDPLWRQRPYELQLALNHANAACALHGIDASEAASIGAAFRHASHGHQLAYLWLDGALDVAANGRCPGLGLDTVEAWLAAAGANPMMQAAGRRQDLAALAGRLAVVRGQPQAALTHFNRALSAYPTPDAAAEHAALLASNGHPAQALAHLDHYQHLAAHDAQVAGWNMPRLHRWVLDRQRYWPHELARLRAVVQADWDLQARGQRAFPDPATPPQASDPP